MNNSKYQNLSASKGIISTNCCQLRTIKTIVKNPKYCWKILRTLVKWNFATNCDLSAKITDHKKHLKSWSEMWLTPSKYYNSYQSRVCLKKSDWRQVPVTESHTRKCDVNHVFSGSPVFSGFKLLDWLEYLKPLKTGVFMLDQTKLHLLETHTDFFFENGKTTKLTTSKKLKASLKNFCWNLKRKPGECHKNTKLHHFYIFSQAKSDTIEHSGAKMYRFETLIVECKSQNYLNLIMKSD